MVIQTCRKEVGKDQSWFICGWWWWYLFILKLGGLTGFLKKDYDL